MDLHFTASVENIAGLNARAAFTESSASVFNNAEGEPVEIDKTHRYIPWGTDNKYPFDLIDLIEADETLATCQIFNAEICYGAGLHYVADNASASVQKQVREFCAMNPMSNYFIGVTQDLKYFSFCVSVIILNSENTRIVKLVRKHACYCRFAEADKNGRIPYVYYADWRKNPEANAIERIELLDIDSPYDDLMVRLGKEFNAKGEKQKPTETHKFAILTRIPGADNTYYPVPYYTALFKGKWFDIKRNIGIAKEAKLRNSAPIKYHIQIAKNYFERHCAELGITDAIAAQEEVANLKKQIIEFLTAAENSGKVWFSEYFVTPDGKVQNDVVINKIDDGKEGGDWSADIAEAVNMICFTMRVHSNLVGSVPGKSQTNNSGSDKRELYTIAQALQKPYHDLLFIPHYVIINYNNWKNVYPDIPFIQLTTLDEKKDAKMVTSKDNNDENNN